MPDNQALYEVATRLLEEGVGVPVIHRVLGLPVESLECLPASRTTRVIDPEDIPMEVSRTISTVIDEANNILINGTPAMKLRLIQMVLGKAMSQMRNQSPRAMDEMRSKLDDLTHGIVGESDDISTD